jgi:hypothetical protein
MDAAFRRVKGAPFAALSPVRISFQHTATGGGGKDNDRDNDKGSAVSGRTRSEGDVGAWGGPGVARGGVDGHPPRLLSLLQDIGGSAVEGALSATDLADGLSFREQVCGLWAVGCGLWVVGCGLWVVGV